MNMNDNPLDEVLLGDKISKLMHDRNYWYSQASDLRKELEVLKGQLKALTAEKEAIINLDNKLLKNRKDEINRYESALSEILTVIDHYDGDVIGKVYEIATNNLRNVD